jgi:hypothetical protein
VKLFKKESVTVQGISGSRGQSLPFPKIPEILKIKLHYSESWEFIL